MKTAPTYYFMEDNIEILERRNDPEGEDPTAVVHELNLKADPGLRVRIAALKAGFSCKTTPEQR